MTRPILYVFAISHYCEKARWALDCLGVDYELRHLVPGLHALIAKRLGAPGSSLPLLVTDERVVHGSGAILEWADSVTTNHSMRLCPDATREEARVLEQRLDDVAGVHTRRYYYSEALVEHPETVRPMFTRDLPPLQGLLLRAAWGRVRALMIRAMDLGFEQGKQSKQIIEQELDWFDGLLSDGRRFLVGERFSRADLTAASLLAPIALPPEHPTYGRLELPPRARADLARWSDRPTARWVREIYRTHR